VTRRLTNKQREALWDTECLKSLVHGRGRFPICALCELPITPGQQWHSNHDRHLPRALGGALDGLSHARCNESHNHDHDTPLAAKAKRIRQKHIGAWRSARPMQGGRNGKLKKKIDGSVVDRVTKEPPMRRL
jgi:hypothetical protein